MRTTTTRSINRWGTLCISVLSCFAAIQLHATSCVWSPSGGDTVREGADISISATPGDPAPKDQGKCKCVNGNLGDWAPTGKFRSLLSGAVTGEENHYKLNTSPTSNQKIVFAHISFEYKCSTSDETKWVDDPSNDLWQQTYSLEHYSIDGPSRTKINEQITLQVKSADGTSPTVDSWDLDGGNQTGSEEGIQVVWSTQGKKTITAVVGGVTLTKTVEVIGDQLIVSIASPGDPAVVALDQPNTFTANEPTNGDGNYSYEWDFGSGTADAGSKFLQVATGVKFGQEAAGKENTVTLIVRDGSGNSGEKSMKVIIPTFEVTEIGFANDKKIRKWSDKSWIDPSDNSPIWKKTSNPGDPVAYVTNEKPTAFGKISVSPSIPNGTTVSLKLKQNGTEVVSVDNLQITNNEASFSATQFNVAISSSLEKISLELTGEVVFKNTTQSAGSVGPIPFYSVEADPYQNVWNLYDRALEKAFYFINAYSTGNTLFRLNNGVFATYGYNPDLSSPASYRDDSGVVLESLDGGSIGRDCVAKAFLMKFLSNSIGISSIDVKWHWFGRSASDVALWLDGGSVVSFQCDRPAVVPTVEAHPAFRYHAMIEMGDGKVYDPSYGLEDLPVFLRHVSDASHQSGSHDDYGAAYDHFTINPTP